MKSLSIRMNIEANTETFIENLSPGLSQSVGFVMATSFINQINHLATNGVISEEAIDLATTYCLNTIIKTISDEALNLSQENLFLLKTNLVMSVYISYAGDLHSFLELLDPALFTRNLTILKATQPLTIH